MDLSKLKVIDPRSWEEKAVDADLELGVLRAEHDAMCDEVIRLKELIKTMLALIADEGDDGS